MRTHLALLRGVNVGGRNRVPMKDLRALATSLGYGDADTYIQSGNLVLSSGSAPEQIEAELERSIGQRFGVACAVVVVTRDELAATVGANPFPHEPDPRCVHVVFRSSPFTPADLGRIEAAVAGARSKGSRDEASVGSRTMYLWTPDGFGRSELAARLSKAAMAGGTARNWATVTTLLEMMGS